MSTSDISKESVYDSRILQRPARYAVSKGAMSVTASTFRAISESTSTHTYSINSPSLQTFIDRAIDWTSTCMLSFNVAHSTVQPPLGVADPIAIYGRDFALCAFPLQSLVSTLTASINDSTVTISTETVLKEILRLVDFRDLRRLRTCPTALDTLADNNVAYGTRSNPLGSFDDADADFQPNGAYYDVGFADTNNIPLVGTQDAYPVPAGAYQWPYANGIPRRIKVSEGAEPVGGYGLNFFFTSKERLVLSPFIYGEDGGVSLFGVNNIQFLLNISSSGVNRVLRCTTQTGRVISNVAFSGTGFKNSQMNLTFLTPSLDLPLPAKSVVPFTDMPRFVSNTGSIIQPFSSGSVTSQTFTLPSVPDALIIYAKPQYTTAAPQANTDGDWYLPPSKINLTFGNTSGLLSSYTPEQLYKVSVGNGLDMPYSQWSGSSWSARSGQQCQTTGGFLVLRPGVDFALSTGEAPGLQGQVTCQFEVTLKNTSPVAYAPVLYLITVQSGFFETVSGSSRVIKNLLSEADVISAPMAPEQTISELKRVVGSGMMGSLGSMLSKARDIYAATKPAISMLKGALPEGKVKGFLGSVGYGECGSGVGHSAGAGGHHAGAGRKKLSERLM